MDATMAGIIKYNVSPDTWMWLQQFKKLPNDYSALNTAFMIIPRKTGKPAVDVTIDPFKNWTIDRLCRVWLLLQWDTTDKDKYYQTIDSLFLSAEMNESVALYSALPFLAYPEIWIKRCAEGIRSNIGSVLEAIMYNNPYPSVYLDQAAWNQLILKAFFTEKNVPLIIGLDRRANKELALILSDYVRERWAAGRKVNPTLWRLVAGFIDDKIFEDIKISLTHDDMAEKEAIALAISESGFEPAKQWLSNIPELKSIVIDKALNWNKISIN
ncbi:EboA domain-containing protein [Mucilaginibacter sp. RCC_168]|uniref:EboA domain-containing protein n=1 Tax=Mucilaginibacter sp. RCC_168 TaxID=3239221 RepID=UPI003526174C